MQEEQLNETMEKITSKIDRDSASDWEYKWEPKKQQIRGTGKGFDGERYWFEAGTNFKSSDNYSLRDECNDLKDYLIRRSLYEKLTAKQKKAVEHVIRTPNNYIDHVTRRREQKKQKFMSQL